MSVDNTEVLSPCISECRLDDESICQGCYRSVDDIVSWRTLDNADRLKAVDAAKQRRLIAQRR